MKLFRQLIRTAVNVATLPISAAKDIITLGGAVTDEQSSLLQQLQKIKDEAGED